VKPLLRGLGAKETGLASRGGKPGLEDRDSLRDPFAGGEEGKKARCQPPVLAGRQFADRAIDIDPDR
jgi:hypothetical protein